MEYNDPVLKHAMPRPPCSVDITHQLSLLERLPELLRTLDATEVAASIVPRIADLLQTDGIPQCNQGGKTTAGITPRLLHFKASKAFLQVLQQQQSSSTTGLVVALIREAAANLSNSDPAVSHMWLDMLLEAVKVIPVGVIHSEVLVIAARQSQIWHDKWSRVFACHLFGKCCSRLSLQELQSEVVPGLVALCQDVAWEVRSAACDQLAHAACCFADSPLLVSALCELGADDSEDVLVSVVGATASSLDSLLPETLVSAVAPLVLRLSRLATRIGSPVLTALATHFGDICLRLSSYLSPDEHSWLADLFQRMMHMGLQRVGEPTAANFSPTVPYEDEETVRWSQQIRMLAASGFPSTVRFLLAEGRFDILLNALRGFSTDPHPPVRQKFAAGLHKTALALGSGKCIILSSDFVWQLGDKNIDVLRELVPNIAPVLLLFSEGGMLSSRDMTSDQIEEATNLLHAILMCEETISASLDWRLYVTLMDQLKALPHCLPSDLIYKIVMPRLLQRTVSVRQLPSRCAVLRTILSILRFNEKPQQQAEIRNMLVKNLKQNKNSYHRKCYLWMCFAALEIFSHSYFKKWFFTHVISLSEDNVATVRQVAVALFPAMESMCKTPEDDHLMEILHRAFEHLCSDVDRQVRISAESINHKLLLNKHATGVTDTEDNRRLTEELSVEARWSHDQDVQATCNTELLSDKPIDGLYNSRTTHLVSTVHSLSTSTSSEEVEDGSFLVDAGVHMPPCHVTHIPAPRTGITRRIQLRNRKSWSGAASVSNGGSRIQATSNTAGLFQAGGIIKEKKLSIHDGMKSTNLQQKNKGTDCTGAHRLMNNTHRKPEKIEDCLKNTESPEVNNKDQFADKEIKLVHGGAERANKKSSVASDRIVLVAAPQHGAVRLRVNRGTVGRRKNLALRNSVAAIPLTNINSSSSETGKPSAMQQQKSLIQFGKGDNSSSNGKKNGTVETAVTCPKYKENPLLNRKSCTLDSLSDQVFGSATDVSNRSAVMDTKCSVEDNRLMDSQSCGIADITSKTEKNRAVQSNEKRGNVNLAETVKPQMIRRISSNGKTSNNQEHHSKLVTSHRNLSCRQTASNKQKTGDSANLILITNLDESDGSSSKIEIKLENSEFERSVKGERADSKTMPLRSESTDDAFINFSKQLQNNFKEEDGNRKLKDVGDFRRHNPAASDVLMETKSSNAEIPGKFAPRQDIFLNNNSDPVTKSLSDPKVVSKATNKLEYCETKQNEHLKQSHARVSNDNEGRIVENTVFQETKVEPEELASCMSSKLILMSTASGQNNRDNSVNKAGNGSAETVAGTVDTSSKLRSGSTEKIVISRRQLERRSCHLDSYKVGSSPETYALPGTRQKQQSTRSSAGAGNRRSMSISTNTPKVLRRHGSLDHLVPAPTTGRQESIKSSGGQISRLPVFRRQQAS